MNEYIDIFILVTWLFFTFPTKKILSLLHMYFSFIGAFEVL